MGKEKKITAHTKQRTVLRWTADITVILIASAVYSLGVHCFISPNDIAPGGVTGVSIILSNFTPVKIGTLIFVLNIPLMILGFIYLSKATMIKTAVSVLAITVLTDIFSEVMPTYSAHGGNGIMAAIFGGALMGIGLGLNYQREGTSGGTDIIIKMRTVWEPS